MKQNSTPFDVTEYDRQIKRTLPVYEEMFQQIIDIVRILNFQSLRWLDVGCGTVLDNFDIQKMEYIFPLKILHQTARKVQDYI